MLEARKARLVVFAGRYTGQVFSLAGPVTTIGRLENNQICLPEDSRISGHQVTIYEQEGEFQVESGAGREGGGVSSLNGRSIESQGRKSLRQGDLLRVGDTYLRFEYEPAGAGVSGKQPTANPQAVVTTAAAQPTAAQPAVIQPATTASPASAPPASASPASAPTATAPSAVTPTTITPAEPSAGAPAGQPSVQDSAAPTSTAKVKDDLRMPPTTTNNEGSDVPVRTEVPAAVAAAISQPPTQAEAPATAESTEAIRTKIDTLAAPEATTSEPVTSEPVSATKAAPSAPVTREPAEASQPAPTPVTEPAPAKATTLTTPAAAPAPVAPAPAPAKESATPAPAAADRPAPRVPRDPTQTPGKTPAAKKQPDAPPPVVDKDEYTFDEAAQRMGVSPDRIAQWANAGVLPTTGMGGPGLLMGQRLIPHKSLEELQKRIGA